MTSMTSSIRPKYALFTLLFLTVAVGAAGSAIAATYHVDWDTGQDAPGRGSEQNPWKTPWYAAGQVGPGDTVIIHAKDDGSVYFNDGKPVLPLGTPNTTWKAARGEKVWLSLTNDRTTSYWKANGKGGTTVSIHADHVTLDGFYVWGSVSVSHQGDGALIVNCDLSGGPDYQGFPAALRLSGENGGNWDVPDGVTIRNCRIHDNLKAFEQGPNNDSALLIYSSRNTTVEYCEFYNTLLHAIQIKARSDKETIRFNYFHDVPSAIEGGSSGPKDWVRIHNNVFVNAGAGVGPHQSAPNGFFVYNNTFINCRRDIYWWFSGGRLSFFNNIHYHADGGGNYQRIDEKWNAGLYTYQNHNDYFTASGSTRWYMNYADRASDLASWQAYLKAEGAGPEAGEQNSKSYDPGFVNASGKFEKPEDFKRKTYPKDGRGGEWPAVMGAYVTGDETVGPLPRRPASGT